MGKSPAYSAVPVGKEGEGHAAGRAMSTQRRTWQPGFFRRFPWAGFVSILLALGFAVAAISVALESDGKPIDYWAVNGYVVQPAVLLSVFATLANALLVYAFTQGATIYWWTTAFEGATLGQLHSSYHYGSGLTAIFSSVSAFNTVALAGIMMPILLMDGPLLQRSVGLDQKMQVSNTNQTIPISPAPLMMGSTGIIPDHASDLQPSLYHPVFAKVLQQYTNREAILFPNQTCAGECQVEILAPGWDIECYLTEEPYHLPSVLDNMAAMKPGNLFPNGTMRPNSTYHGPKIEQTVFQTSVVYNYTLSNSEKLANHGATQYGIHLKTAVKSTPGLSGIMSHHDCWLREAIVRYPLKMQNGTVTLESMPASKNRTVERVLRSMEMQGQGDYPSTLGGFWLALHTAFNTKAKLYPVGGWYSLLTTTPASSQYLRAPNASALQSYEVTWEDPMDDMILMANELAFRTAYATSSSAPGSPGLSSLSGFIGYNLTSEQPYILSPNLTSAAREVSQKALVSATIPTVVYATHRGWLAGGFVVICLACLAVMPTFWGWWRLGRQVSMSPLEIARAFEAPMLQHADPNATGEDLKKNFGGERLRLLPVVDGKAYEALDASTGSGSWEPDRSE